MIRADELATRLDQVLGPQSIAAPPRWLLFGSGVLYLHGLRDEIGDLDLFVTPSKWGELIDGGWSWETPRAGDPPIAAADCDGLPRLNAFFDWDGRHEVAFAAEGGIVAAAFAHAHWYRGVWCQSLRQLMVWKEWLHRHRVHPKHGRDAEAIRAYLGEAGH